MNTDKWVGLFGIPSSAFFRKLISASTLSDSGNVPPGFVDRRSLPHTPNMLSDFIFVCIFTTSKMFVRMSNGSSKILA